MKILVTGASGFVGGQALGYLKACGKHEVIGCSRSGDHGLRVSPELSEGADWSGLLSNVDVVVHVAGLVHDPSASFEAYQRVNVRGTLALAEQAVEVGVRRFIFISSIGVNGYKTTDNAFTERDIPNPGNDYARSKWQAEQVLRDFAATSGLEVIIIRPPLVYGPQAPGNFGMLTRIVEKSLPLPLAGIDNRRSFVSVWNLADLIRCCIDHPEAPGQVFLVSDGEDVSTSDLLSKLGEASGSPVRLFRVPVWSLRLPATLLGKRGIYDRLFDSLRVDIHHAQMRLEWRPTLGLDEGLRRCFCSKDKAGQ
ncbi:NAD-dependent epimerase/dehydratase family protein [Halomonas pacifica]|uniref:Epimerase n=1 Tax=Bisbaumannia pacifica TaxID=77098 RepID=A0A510X3B0_9GAMM|nr:NAD-dependent epimerase/dehydratase family protein [Halomonas pacifica]MBH8580579.1 NAD-dependent epimerase/dehydratase family protein [Halomonas pacifica]MDC8805502.1 NAD-dependent epimerase/dehydratase family protein [Halomonas pacifica]GEK45904.1 epimerase [Halomonas pacifica]